MKLCTRCKLMKPLSEFHKYAVSKDGLKSECKECNSKRDKASYRRRLREKSDKEKREKGIDHLVSVMPSHLPALTLSGVIWSPGFTNKHRSCDDCPLLETCGEAVNSGNYAGCEGALESEIWHVQMDSIGRK